MFSNQNVHKAFQSILRADYISITDSRQLEMFTNQTYQNLNI